MSSQKLADVLRTTGNMGRPRLSVSSENTSQKMFIGNDAISEIVNGSDSDCGNVTERFNSDTCKVHPSFSSSSSSSSDEEEVFNPEPDRGRNRTCRERADADFELGWKEKNSEHSETWILLCTWDK
jgi:hypothetical protein